jgi:hypothetical protein
MKSPTSEKPKRGGAREGAGRKPNPEGRKQNITIKLPPDLIDKLKQSDESQAVQIEKALRQQNNW